MGKGRFLNQKLGKRTSRRLKLLKPGSRAAPHQRTVPFEEARLLKTGRVPPKA